ncbi:NAD(P)H-binding protein [uncultured Tolumonas sp.]|uniref:NAD(P)H-binding protein n=1 Tax=uncultured Tolumonas sp. TaxID=263765 RepID=UPI00292FE7E9|nr:NAD(P)H-binding protein [uncultured Tolumonas sp.]
MKKILILGANGSLAKVATRYLLDNTDAKLTLFLRNSYRLNNIHPDRIHIIDGDVMDLESLKYAMEGQDVVYANLSGNMKAQAETIIKAMHQTGLKRLIFISSMGIYGEVPGEKYRSILNPYRDSATEIEASDLDYTVIRPGWFTNENIIDYRITLKGEPFEGHDVSRKSIADLIMQLIETPDLYIRESVGISQV